jgi:predicted nucleic acid-binding protein
MAESDQFFDTNVLLYLVSGDQRKAERAEQLVAAGGVVSIQVLTEFADVARRKFGRAWSDIGEVLDVVRATCSVEPLSLDTHNLALRVAERYKLRIYDGMIVAAAVLAGCSILVSEDMHAGQTIDRITVRNPFLVQ